MGGGHGGPLSTAGPLERWSDRAIVERVVEENPSGIDLDPRAVLQLSASQTLDEVLAP